jgi:small-conductance mechanosensitive channel
MDKSIKPGDVISLEGDNVYGVVHKLNARFVSIRTREGREHLIPNEFFISNKTINWSHSDPLIRISIDFKVSYDADLELVEKILLEIASKTKRVLKEPPPTVYFTSIKENAVELQLRVWLNDPQNGKSGIISAIIFNAWKRFKEENIEIPYTPSELHIIYPKSNSENDRLKVLLDEMQSKRSSENH